MATHITWALGALLAAHSALLAQTRVHWDLVAEAPYLHRSNFDMTFDLDRGWVVAFSGWDGSQ